MEGSGVAAAAGGVQKTLRGRRRVKNSLSHFSAAFLSFLAARVACAAWM